MVLTLADEDPRDDSSASIAIRMKSCSDSAGASEADISVRLPLGNLRRIRSGRVNGLDMVRLCRITGLTAISKCRITG
jgi:hypothetical protein